MNNEFYKRQINCKMIQLPSAKRQNGIRSTTFCRKCNDSDENMGSVGVVALQNVTWNGTTKRQVAKSGCRRICDKTDADGRYDTNREPFHCTHLMIIIILFK